MVNVNNLTFNCFKWQSSSKLVLLNETINHSDDMFVCLSKMASLCNYVYVMLTHIVYDCFKNMKPTVSPNLNNFTRPWHDSRRTSVQNVQFLSANRIITLLEL